MKGKRRTQFIILVVALVFFYVLLNGTLAIYRQVIGDTIDLSIIDPSGTHQVTFVTRGGSAVSPNPRTVAHNAEIGELPTTTLANYNFDGWYTEPNEGDGTKIDSHTVITGDVTYYAHWVKIVCKKASTLHTETCAAGGSCIGHGYSVNDTITYGTIPITDNPLAGYAYDCDVNDDGTWDPATERFYYVRGYGGTSNVENSVLVHFTSFDEDGQMDDSTTRKIYQYNASLEWLPTSATWDNPALIEMDGNVTRFSSRADIEAACGSIDGGGFTDCQFYLENTRFQSDSKGRSGLWLSAEGSTHYRIHSGQLSVITAASDSSNAVRPVIEIPSNTIEDFQPPENYTITFDPNQGQLDDPSEATRSVPGGTAIGTLPTATRTNYIFDGWYTDPDDGEGTEITDHTIVTGNDTYYAHWKEKITITFNANGGTVSPGSKDIAKGAAIGSMPVPEYGNHDFVGWFTDQSAGTQVTESTTFNASTEIFAHWEESSSNYVFHIPGECKFTSSGIQNGENGNCISTVNPTGSNIDYTESTLSAKKYIDTQVALYNTTNHDKNYEIHFEIVDYVPSANVNQATFFNTKNETTGYPGLVVRRSSNNIQIASRRTSSANSEVLLPYNTVTKLSVYRIGGEIYYSVNDGERVLINNLSEYNPVFDLTTWFGATPTNAQATTAQRFFVGTLSNIYIKIEDNSDKATITYDPNYTGASTFDEQHTINQPIGTLPTITRSGYSLLGWYTDPDDGEGTQITSSTVVTDDDTYYAHWAEDVTVTLNTNGGTVSPNTITVPYNTAVGELPTPAKTGHTFAGWYQDPGFNTPATSATIITEDTDFYAKWIENITVTLNPKGGTVSPSSISFAPGTAIGQLPTPEKTGYTFEGWFTDDGTYLDEVTSSTIFNSTTEIYAKWIESITVTFNPKGGTVSPSSVTFAKGTAIGQLPTPEKVGYTFEGWFTDDGTYSDEVTSSTVFNSTTEIYANWEETSDITITFDADGGTVSPTSVTITPGTEIGELPIPVNTPDKTGYVFAGWYTDNTWTTEVTESTTFNSTTTIIARWVEDTYVARIGNTCYTTLQAAVAAVPTTGAKTTIIILQDINNTATTTIESTQWVELAIGSYTIETSTSQIDLITNNGKLDINDGTLTSASPSSSGTNKKGYIIKNNSGATLNITGGTLSYTRAADTEGKVIENLGGAVNITGGTLTCNSQAAVINNRTNGILNISGGHIEGSNTTKGQAVYNEGGTVTVSGDAELRNVSQSGSSSGRAALTNASGTVNILGGTFISTNNAGVSNKGTMTIGTNDGSIDITSPMLQGGTYGLENTSGTATIYDGIFKGKGTTQNKAIRNEGDVVHIATTSFVHTSETIDGSQYDVAYLEDSAVNITINFNKNGGDDVSYNTKTLTEEGPIGELPTAAKDGTEFLGWFTSATGGEKLLSTTEITESDDGTTYYAHYTVDDTVCKPATTLHSSGNTDFGQIPSGGTLSAGDAFDCDVNGDGTFDATNERFYYLTNTADGKAVMIFSNNVTQGQSDVSATCSATGVSYAGTYTEGPTTAMAELPTTEQWKNVSIYTQPRTITNENGVTAASDVIYTGKAARLANLDEIKAATTSSINGTVNELASYPFLLENTPTYDASCRSNYWLETTHSSGGATRINGATNGKNLGHATGTSAIRPVIEVPYSVIDGVVNIVEFDTIPTAMRTYFNNIDTWAAGSDDSSHSSFDTAMTNNLNANNCVYYQGDNVNTEYGSVHCDQPNKYDTGVTGNIKVYEYNESTGVTANEQAAYVSNDNGKLYNFIPGKVYYWESASDSTKNGYVRPTGERRILTINGTNRKTRNVRDLGGLPVDTDGNGTIDGKIKFQKLYRGEKIWGGDNATKSIFQNLGVNNELDLRQSSEAVTSEEDKLTNYISNEIIHYRIDYTEFGTPASEARFNGKSYYQLAREAAIDVMNRVVNGNDDYALYFHCRIGADRTGTLAYILEGLLGVPTEYRYQDYELTVFFGLRERTRYYYAKGSDTYKFIYLKNAIRNATPNNTSGVEDVKAWFLQGSDNVQTDEALIAQFKTKMIDYN
ncbi:MAG: InlB B-repeat-containing protein [Bacilli bacterium]|nr:InlB B-repeat-containing protein [Bacilli bacterium]